LSVIQRIFNKTEAHEFAVVIEICVLLFVAIFAWWASLISSIKGISKDLVGEFGSMTTTLTWVDIVLLFVCIMHGSLTYFITYITKKNREIAAKSRKNLHWTIFFSQYSKVALQAFAFMTQPKRNIDIKQSAVERYLKDRTVELVKNAITQQIFPRNMSGDYIFKEVADYLDSLSNDDVAKLFSIDQQEDASIDELAGADVLIGPGVIMQQLMETEIPSIVKEFIKSITDGYKRLHGKDILPDEVCKALDYLGSLWEQVGEGGTIDQLNAADQQTIGNLVSQTDKLRKEVKSREVNLTPYLLPLAAPLYFNRSNEDEGFADQAEFEELIQAYAPKSVIIWQPEGVDELVRESTEYIPEMDTSVESFAIEGTYFYLGSAAGIPMLLDLISLDRIQDLYHMRIKLGNIHSLRLTSLIYIIMSLIDKSHRQKDTEMRTEIQRQTSEFNTELIQQQFMVKMGEIKAEHQNPYEDKPTTASAGKANWKMVGVGAGSAAATFLVLLVVYVMGWLPCIGK
jgi:hypothetical protein